MKRKYRVMILGLVLTIVSLFYFHQQSLKELHLNNAGLKCSGYITNFPKIKDFELWASEQQFVGYQLSVVSSGNQYIDCVYGLKTAGFINTELRVDENLPYASMTKVLTAYFIHRIIENGDLSYESYISELFEEYEGSGITIEHLMNHSAGFNRDTDGDITFKGQDNCSTKIEAFKSNSLKVKPGEKYIYSNLGYCLLGKTLEVIQKIDISSEVKKFYARYENKKFGKPISILESQYMLTGEGFYENNSPISVTNTQFNEDYIAAYGGWVGSAGFLARVYKESGVNDAYLNFELPSYGPSFEIKNNCTNFKKRNCLIGGAYFNRVDNQSWVFWKNGRLPGTESIVLFNSNGNVVVFIANSSDIHWLERSSLLAEKLSAL